MAQSGRVDCSRDVVAARMLSSFSAAHGVSYASLRYRVLHAGIKESAMESKRSQQAITALRSFLDTPLETVLSLHTKRASEQDALALFHTVAATVPAYQAFLAAQAIDPRAIQTLEDFKTVPA